MIRQKIEAYIERLGNAQAIIDPYWWSIEDVCNMVNRIFRGLLYNVLISRGF